MSQTTQNNALETTTTNSTELQTSRSQAEAQHTIQAAMIIAQQMPRDEQRALAALTMSCNRPSFAEKAEYSFPRGGGRVTGPSVHMAREIARVWGNIQYGFNIVNDDDDSRTIQAYAWDLQTNTKVFSADAFKKRIQRKDKKTGSTKWVRPDERDLRELTNRRAAICVRNCILQLAPADLVEDAVERARKTALMGVSDNIDNVRKGIISGFASLNIEPDEVEEYMGAKLKHLTPDQLSDLRKIYQSIKDGNSRWSDYVQIEEPAPKSKATTTSRKKKKKEPEPEKTQAELDAEFEAAAESEQGLFSEGE